MLEGGTFRMGTDSDVGFAADGEGPVREVELDSFAIGATAVTSNEFARFVNATGHVTDAERFGWSFVFQLFVGPEAERHVQGSPDGVPWWWAVEGASWRAPEGPGSDVGARQNHPVVHVSWNDAAAYCAWSTTRLPTEAEWEYAARGGLDQSEYPWGNELRPGGEYRCNIWQGEFPRLNTAEDGYAGTAPVRAFKPNGLGLWNVAGNVWEWSMDWFSPDFHIDGPRVNPAGPPKGTERVLRGGSYLCHDSYCNRYRVAARSHATPDSSTGNCGFRVATDALSAS